MPVLANPLGAIAHLAQHPHTDLQVVCRNVLDEVTPQFKRGGVDSADDAMGAALEMHGFAAAIAGGVFPGNPAFIFEMVK